MRLAILDDYQNAALAAADWNSLGENISVEAFHDILAGEDAAAARLFEFEIIVAMRERTPFPRSLLERLPKLKLLVTAGMRNAAIDLEAADRQGVVVTGTSTLAYPAAELAWGLILTLARNIARESQAMRLGGWQSTVGVGLQGKLLGIIGLGRLGTQVAGFGQAFQMDVVAWSQNLTQERAAAAGVDRVKKDELFRRADFISVHVPLSSRTQGLIGAAELDLMKPTAYLVNTSRGPVVDEKALVDALRGGKIAGAALDVYDQEPLPRGHALRTLENVVLTPHLGYVTIENYRMIYGQAVEDIRAFLAGKPLRVISPV